MIEYIVGFVSRYSLIILLSTIFMSAIVLGVRLDNPRAYRRRQVLFMSALLGSLFAAVVTLSTCFTHWVGLSFGGRLHIACGDVVLPVVDAICTTWVALLTASFAYTIVRGTISYYFGSKMVTRLLDIVPLRYDYAPRLHQNVNRLSLQAGVLPPSIGLLCQGRPTIFSVGGQGQSTIVISVGFLETLSHDEITACLAHEICHIKNKDHFFKTVASSLKIAVPFSPLSYLIEPALSRDREFLADQESVKLTRKPKSLISALMKLSEADLLTLKALVMKSVPVCCMIAFAWRNLQMLSTHPPVAERIRRLRDLERGGSSQVKQERCGFVRQANSYLRRLLRCLTFECYRV